MPDEPVFGDDGPGEWEGWPADQLAERGGVQWKTLVSRGVTPTSGLTAGIARIAPGDALRLHRHAQAEIYVMLEGSGRVTVGSTVREVGPGTTVFIPGDAVHGMECAGPAEVRLAYVLDADAFEDVEYIFDV